MKPNLYTLWGSELSPFYLKVQACLRFQKNSINYQPQQGGYFKALKHQLKVELIQKRFKKITWPIMNSKDELPLVPYMFNETGQSFYDSSAFAHWLDQSPNAKHLPLSQFNDKSLEFVIALIDEYADEFGLYMVHHMRWKYSALDNTAGQRLANEFKVILGPLKWFIEKSFPKRQVRRLPYLFSVAPIGFKIKNLPKSLQPPIHADFPATHELLENAYKNLLAALESKLATSSYLLGNSFTLADASIYGQLGMNLADPSAAQFIQNQAPKTYKWLQAIQQGKFTYAKKIDLKIDNSIKALLAEIKRTFIPLMQQNAQAYDQYKQKGQLLFNEKAFDKHAALYEGELDGIPFKSVAKSFQVSSWRVLLKRWESLNEAEQARIENIIQLNLAATITSNELTGLG